LKRQEVLREQQRLAEERIQKLKEEQMRRHQEMLDKKKLAVRIISHFNDAISATF